ncbi:hypothetical protein CDAR_176221 [Caerostris darwini]|uniref:Uncharacterized protein n=1 Tax=Caerostris darwini TaxID=1538125 RepID=A0AAV4P108_9ARAC|nr:hypothetical protein CDAR_176221 [Caerostris darwini]
MQKGSLEINTYCCYRIHNVPESASQLVRGPDEWPLFRSCSGKKQSSRLMMPIMQDGKMAAPSNTPELLWRHIENYFSGKKDSSVISGHFFFVPFDYLMFFYYESLAANPQFCENNRVPVSESRRQSAEPNRRSCLRFYSERSSGLDSHRTAFVPLACLESRLFHGFLGAFLPSGSGI